MDRKPRIISHLTRIAIMNLLLLCTAPVKARVDETQIDTYEGLTVQLPCRFPPPPENVTYSWLTYTNYTNYYLNFATIDNHSLSPNYGVYMNVPERRYDLQIKNVSYENNGMYVEGNITVAHVGRAGGAARKRERKR